MNILITGGNGYVGSSLYNALKDKYDITLLTRKECDLTNLETDYFCSKYFDVVIHTAIVGGSRLKEEDDSILEQNLKMWRTLLAHKINYGRLINFGSGAELDPKTPYGISKQIIRESLLSKNNFYNLRIYGVFDENEWDTRFIKTCINNYLDNKPMIIHEDKFMDFIYMKDLIKIVDYYIQEKNPPKEYNCIYLRNYTLKNIATYINKLDKNKVDIVVEKEEWGENYMGKNNGEHYLDKKLEMIGILQGIENVYEILKYEKYKSTNPHLPLGNNSLYSNHR